MSAPETAYLLGKLIEASPQEQEQITKLLVQHGTLLFWAKLEDWNLPAVLLEQLQSVKQVLQTIQKGRDT